LKEDSPSFQWYPKDYLSSSAVLRMNLAQEGAYRRLLDYQWMEFSIPDDLEEISVLCRVSTKEMERLWPAIRRCFSSHPEVPGRLINQRLEKERAKQKRRKAERSVSGRRGAAKRWHSDDTEDGSAMAQPSEAAIANDSFASASAVAIASAERDLSLSPVEGVRSRSGKSAASLGFAFDRMFSRHPRPGGEVFANRAYFEEVRQGRIRPDGEPRRDGLKNSLTVSEVEENFEAYLVCPEWKEGFAPHFSKWIESGLYLRKPPSQQQAQPAGTTDEHRRRDNDLDQLMGLGS
jgi:uncharacterized protein YdaU (DUF1376 family)